VAGWLATQCNSLLTPLQLAAHTKRGQVNIAFLLNPTFIRDTHIHMTWGQRERGGASQVMVLPGKNHTKSMKKTQKTNNRFLLTRREK
jgi:hypothetical protein